MLAAQAFTIDRCKHTVSPIATFTPMCLPCFNTYKAGKNDLHVLFSDQTRKHTNAGIDVMKVVVERFSSLVSVSKSRAMLLVADHVDFTSKLLWQDSVMCAFDRSISEVYVNLHRASMNVLASC